MVAHVSGRRVLDWFLPASLGATTAALLGVGFVLALSGRFGEPLGPPPAAAVTAPQAGRYTIVALGDSLTRGTGDPGGGYAARVADALRRAGHAVTLTNLAVPGAEAGDLLRQLDAPGVLAQVSAARLILLSAGGNDLTHALRGSAGEGDAEPEAALARTTERLHAIVARLRAANPTAPIRLLGLYNPFEILPSEEAQARAQLLDWNVGAERAAIAQHGVLVVPTADLFADRPDRLAVDRFHPGPKGHDAIAQRVLSTLRDADP
jgi:lysophospholipase L1-like esterase